MDIDDASDMTVANTFGSLIQIQDDLAALESEADVVGELDPLTSELANLHAELQDKVRA